MHNIRIIPRLDVKGPNLIKGIHLEGLRVIGDPNQYAKQYYQDGADEIIYIDAVASLYGRENLLDIVHHTTNDVFVPLTAGGGIRSIEDARSLLNVGADKIAINTAAVCNPNLIREMAQQFGSQCVVLSIEAIQQPDKSWQNFTDSGRERTGLDVVKWAQQAEELGAGEILLTSVDREGTSKGFDLDLIQAVSLSVSIPVIASGGMNSVSHMQEAITIGRADAIAMAGILHYARMNLREIRDEGIRRCLPLRRFP
jgi:imidazole glycerol-phosphate synthase subunit HisF